MQNAMSCMSLKQRFFKRFHLLRIFIDVLEQSQEQTSILQTFYDSVKFLMCEQGQGCSLILLGLGLFCIYIIYLVTMVFIPIFQKKYSKDLWKKLQTFHCSNVVTIQSLELSPGNIRKFFS